MLKIDFGSGYNPKKGYKTCDITYSPFLDYVTDGCKIYDKEGELHPSSVDVLYARNTLHHIQDLQPLIQNFYKYLKPNGVLEIIDCRKEYFDKNILLDNIWYRYINKNNNIYISNRYRNYSKICIEVGFKLVHKKFNDEKETTIFKKPSNKAL